MPARRGSAMASGSCEGGAAGAGRRSRANRSGGSCPPQKFNRDVQNDRTEALYQDFAELQVTYLEMSTAMNSFKTAYDKFSNNMQMLAVDVCVKTKRQAAIRKRRAVVKYCRANDEALPPPDESTKKRPKIKAKDYVPVLEVSDDPRGPPHCPAAAGSAQMTQTVLEWNEKALRRLRSKTAVLVRVKDSYRIVSTGWLISFLTV